MTIFTFPIVNSSSLLGSGQTVEMPKMETWESSLASTVYSNFLLDQQVIRRSSLCFSHMYHGFHVTLLPQGISFLFCWVLEYTKQMWGSEFSNTQVFKQRWGLPHQRDFFFARILLRVTGLSNDFLASPNSRVWYLCFHDLIFKWSLKGENNK